MKRPNMVSTTYRHNDVLYSHYTEMLEDATPEMYLAVADMHKKEMEKNLNTK